MAHDKVYTRTRGLKQPRGPDKGQLLKYALKRARKQKHKWPVPEDAYLILDLHFSVKSFRRQSFHADATLEIPVEGGFDYFSVSHGGGTRAGALRGVIVEIQNSKWFHHMKKRGVYFKVSGAGMEELYRGYL
jgi:hypothetical protein